jgi:GTP-binding protein EngB required for normal cell division
MHILLDGQNYNYIVLIDKYDKMTNDELQEEVVRLREPYKKEYNRVRNAIKDKAV